MCMNMKVHYMFRTIARVGRKAPLFQLVFDISEGGFDEMAPFSYTKRARGIQFLRLEML